MAVYSKLVFPLRTMSFFSLCLAINTIFYNRNIVIKEYIMNKSRYANISSPSLPPKLIGILESDKNYADIPDYKKHKKEILGWCITADIFFVFLFICMILGFLTNKPYINFVIGVFHFIAVVLCTHMITKKASFNFMICAVAFGVLLPSLIEIFTIGSLVCFKNDFYVQSK